MTTEETPGNVPLSDLLSPLPEDRLTRPHEGAYSSDQMRAYSAESVALIRADRDALRQALYELWEQGKPAVPDMCDEELAAWNAAADVLTRQRP